MLNTHPLVRNMSYILYGMNTPFRQRSSSKYPPVEWTHHVQLEFHFNFIFNICYLNSRSTRLFIIRIIQVFWNFWVHLTIDYFNFGKTIITKKIVYIIHELCTWVIRYTRVNKQDWQARLYQTFLRCQRIYHIQFSPYLNIRES